MSHVGFLEWRVRRDLTKLLESESEAKESLLDVVSNFFGVAKEEVGIDTVVDTIVTTYKELGLAKVFSEGISLPNAVRALRYHL